MIYQFEWEMIRHENYVAPKRIECKCGWMNNQPSKKNKDKARCKKCGLLIDKQELFKAKLKKEIKL